MKKTLVPQVNPITPWSIETPNFEYPGDPGLYPDPLLRIMRITVTSSYTTLCSNFGTGFDLSAFSNEEIIIISGTGDGVKILLVMIKSRREELI